MKQVLQCQNVSVHYRQQPRAALQQLNLSLAPGERVALLGLNGSGKTSLLAAIAGLVRFEGAIIVQGILSQPATLRRIRDQLGFLFGTPDDQLLFPRVIDDVAFTLKRRGFSTTAALRQARQILARLHIADLAEQAPHRLSQGQRQRVALAGILIAEPPLLLLDEPTSALDYRGKAELARLLGELPCAILMATHDLPFARQLATRFVTLENGILTQDSCAPPKIPEMYQ